MNDENPWISVDDEMPPDRVVLLMVVDLKLRESYPNIYDSPQYITGYFMEESNQVCLNDLDEYENYIPINEITHWKRIVGPSKPSSPIMVEAPNKENTYTGEEDPHNMKIGAYLYKKERSAVWWNNTKGKRLWYWHNDKWNRAI